ncbi:XTP/dITP diphosphatase [Flavobacteriaceae bacterium UJ101]|nr:XTP/dITP diphosphatase [Flavobacteriaceae bacterium UJ101]
MIRDFFIKEFYSQIIHKNMKSREKELKAFNRLLDIMDDLREKCPWDKKQTIESLRHLTIEEVYELSDAIIDSNLEEVKNELGDLMLHLVFYSKIGSEKKAFDMVDVLDGICEKLIYRHPHIYGDVEVVDEEEVKKNWEKLKLKEGKGDRSVLGGVPKSLPSMIKALRIQEKVKGVGFEFESKEQVWDKIQEELQEFQEAKSFEEQELEFGDVLFSIINYARFVDINPELALEKTNKKFIYRFQKMEKLIKDQKLEISDLSIEKLDSYWGKVKE